MPSLGFALELNGGAVAPGGPLLWTADFSALSLGIALSLPGALVLARASGATVQLSASQVLTGIGADIARIGATGAGPRGLVLEEARTNIVYPSRDVHGGLGTWTTGASVTRTADAGVGPDGATSADRLQVASGGVSAYLGPLGSVPHVASAWGKRGAAVDGPWTLGLQSGVSPNVAATTTAGAAWQRLWVYNATANYCVPADGRATDVSAAAAADVLVDLVQVEAAQFASEAIATTGGTATRAGERLYHPTRAALLDAGRVGLRAKLYPKGAATAYGAAMRLWTIDASNYAEISHSTRRLNIVINGVSWSPATALSWNAGDLLEVWVEAGGGSLQSHAAYRINNGAWTDLGTSGSPQIALASGGEIDLLCSATAAQLTAWVSLLEAYRSGQRPAGVP